MKKNLTYRQAVLKAVEAASPTTKQGRATTITEIAAIAGVKQPTEPQRERIRVAVRKLRDEGFVTTSGSHQLLVEGPYPRHERAADEAMAQAFGELRADNLVELYRQQPEAAVEHLAEFTGKSPDWARELLKKLASQA